MPLSCLYPARFALRRRLAVACVLALSAGPLLAQPVMTPGADTLEEIVVTAAGFAQVIREAPASISIISRKDLETKPYHSLAEALADVEGIDVDAAVDKTGAPSIAIRGMPSDYTLVLVDGRRQNAAGNVTPNNFGGTANNFIPPLSAIERIEVIRGPMSTLYGSDAMGGVVNIITRKTGDAWRGSLGLNATLQQDSDFGDTNGGNLYAAGRIGKAPLGLALWGGWFKRSAADIAYLEEDGNSVTPWMGANPVAYDNFNLGLRLSLLAGENHDLWLESTRGRQRYDNSAGQVGTLGSGGYADTQRYHRDQNTIAWTARWGIGTLDTTLMDSTTETIGRLIPPGVPGAGNPRTLETTNTVFDTKFVTGFGAHMLSVGGQYWDAGMHDGVAPQPFAFDQWAVFAEDEWSLRDDLNLTLGVRNDEHSTFGGHVSPRAYLVWNASANWVLKGGISQGYKTPRVEQLVDGINGFGGQGRIPLIGTPGLKPETSTTSEIGVHFAGDGGASASFGVFHNDFKDKIASGVPVFNCTFAASPDRPGCVDVGHWPLIDTFGQSVNIDEAVTRGAELAFAVPFATRWEWLVNYTFTESEQKSGASAGEPLSDTPRHMLNSTLHWDVSDTLSLSLRGEYRSDRYRGAGAAQDQLGDFRSYGLLHLASTWRIRDNLRFNAAINNLADKDFIDYHPYVSNATTGAVSYANSYANSEDGRRLWVSATMDF